MPGKKAIITAISRGFLSRLAHDVRGNTLAILAAALIPMAGLVGGGIDISRMYITKTRLQHACDAGALAGRKAMGGGTWAQSNGMPNATALQFFNDNFQTGAYGSTSVTSSFSENAGKVSGTASAVLPMTLMRIFGKTTDTLTVTCDAEMRLPNTDVMFVLDNTGSMADPAVSTDTISKIDSLKTAVKCFYEIVARLDTDATCATGNPGTSGTGTQVQIRFGFVPYSTNVNVGYLLPPSYFANSWTYDSRKLKSIAYPNPGTPVKTTTYAWDTPGAWVSQQVATAGSSASYCQSHVPPDTTPTATGSASAPYASSTTQSNGVQTVIYKIDTPVSKHQYQYSAYSTGATPCRYSGRTVTGTQTDTYTRTDVGVDTWTYGPTSIDISGLKNGTSWNNSFQAPIANYGANRTISWDGCIEERQTVRATNYSPIPSGANDLNIDMVPTSGDTTTQWAPALPSLIYLRQTTSGYNTSTSNWNTATVDSTTDFSNNVSYYCPAAAVKLRTWPVAADFDTYVDSLTPTGNTYHDIGMLWGARLMSPTGIFASENALTPAGGEIQRHMIFMTDGDTNAINTDYAAYGLPWFDRRQTPTGSPPSNSDLNDQVNARFLALCTAVKNMNITLWVISFGDGSNSTTESRLNSCATPGRYFVARDSATLQTTFASIANQISQLRLTK